MTVTVVLRLLPGPLRSGELVGHVEVVATSRVEPVRGVADVIRVARDAARHVVAPETEGPSRGGPTPPAQGTKTR